MYSTNILKIFFGIDHVQIFYLNAQVIISNVDLQVVNFNTVY